MTQRRWIRVVSLAVASLLVAACSITDPAAVPPTTDPAPSGVPLRTPQDAGSYEVVVVGGSVMNEVAIGLGAALDPLGWVKVRNVTKRGVEVMDMSADLSEVWDEALELYQPEVVIAQMSFRGPIFDCVGTPEEREACTQQGRRLWYLEQLREVTDQLTSTGAHLVWLGFPPIAPSPDPAESEVRDAIGAEYNDYLREYESLDERFTFIDGRTPLEGEDGEYSSYLPDGAGRWLQARKPDGLHLCPHGVSLVVTAMIPELIHGWEPNLTAPWVQGTWRNQETFTTGSRPFDPEVVCTDEPSPERKMLLHVSAGSGPDDFRG